QWADAGILAVEHPPQLVPQEQPPTLLATAVVLVELLGVDLGGTGQSPLDQQRIEPCRCQRSGRQFVRPRCPDVAEDRTRDLKHALQRLNALGLVGDPELVNQVQTVQRIDAAKLQQLREVVGRRRSDRQVLVALV